MGCFPDRGPPKYEQLRDEKEINGKRVANPYKNIDSIYVPIQVNDSHINSKSGVRYYKASPRKRIPPLAQERSPQPNRFQRKKTSDLKQENGRNRQGKLVRKSSVQRAGSYQRKKGITIFSPFKDHLITNVETPSESIKTSILNDLENNPSIFFVRTKEKDLDAIFNKQKQEVKVENRRNSYKSMSPRSISKISSEK